MRWMNGCNTMLKWEKSRKSTKVAYGPHTDIWKINESCTRSYKGGMSKGTPSYELVLVHGILLCKRLCVMDQLSF